MLAEQNYEEVRKNRIVVVSNRLPVAIKRGENGRWRCERGGGGLVTAMLPWRSQILRSMLEYDLPGFQTIRDRRNFIQCVRRFLKRPSPRI